MFCPRCQGVGSPLEGGFFCSACHACFCEKQRVVHADHLIEPESTHNSVVVRRRNRPDLRTGIYAGGCLLLMAIAAPQVAGAGVRSFAGIVLLGCTIASLFLAYVLVRDAVGRVVLRFSDGRLRVDQRPAFLGFGLIIEQAQIQCVWVRCYEDENGRYDTYDVVVERERWGSERVVGRVADVEGAVALAELFARRLGVRSDTRSAE